MAMLGAGENPGPRRYEKARAISPGRRLDLTRTAGSDGVQHLSRREVIDHWEATSRLYDLAAYIPPGTTPFFASDISAVARPISIDGTAIPSSETFIGRPVLVSRDAGRSLVILEEVAPTHLHTCYRCVRQLAG
jgi:hypothetical protein